MLSPTKLVVQPPSCEAGPQDLTVTEVGAVDVDADRQVAFLAKPVVEACAGHRRRAAGDRPLSGGTAATVTVVTRCRPAPVQVLLTAAA